MATPDELWPKGKHLEAECLVILAWAVRGDLSDGECRSALRAYLVVQPREVVALAGRMLLLEEAVAWARRGEGAG
jgi:hypothetical protein